MRTIFNDADLQEHFIRMGYSHVSLLSPEQVSYTQARLNEMRPDDKFAGNRAGAYHCSYLDKNKAYRRQVQDLVHEVFDPLVKKFLHRYHIYNANFYVKAPGTGQFQVHQNWPAIEDLNDTTVTIWCPLLDTVESNGTIQVIPGSHKIVPHIETRNARCYFHGFTKALIEKYLKPVPVKAGDGIIFDDGLIHWSRRNDSDQPRTAVQILCIPDDVRPIYFFKENDQRFEVIDAPESFFLEHDHDELLVRQPQWKNLGFVPNRNRDLTEEEFADLLARGPEIRAKAYASSPK
jgi:hypothetical protein